MEEYEIQEEKIEDEIEKRVPPASNRRGRLSKFAIRSLAVLFALFIGFWGLAQYMQWKGVKNVEKTAELLEQIQKEDFERAMADTFGGETPQETLRMYIEAVEAEDYELASAYLVKNQQIIELEILNKTEENNNIDFLLGLINKALESRGFYSSEGDRYTIEEPVFIEFILYPNGVWKIVEI